MYQKKAKFKNSNISTRSPVNWGTAGFRLACGDNCEGLSWLLSDEGGPSGLWQHHSRGRWSRALYKIYPPLPKELQKNRDWNKELVQVSSSSVHSAVILNSRKWKRREERAFQRHSTQHNIPIPMCLKSKCSKHKGIFWKFNINLM